MKQLHFISSVPRSGSTLLCNILNQNPKFYASQTSALADVLFGIRNQWPNLVEHQAHPDEEARKRVLKGVMAEYYDVTKPVIFDKSRAWPSLIEMVEYVTNKKVKILVPVRDLRDILSSWEIMWRKKQIKGQTSGDMTNFMAMQSLEGRLQYFTRNDQPIGLAINRIKDAVKRGYKDRLHFVHFENLTTQPELTLRGIYEFLQEDYYRHDFNHVEQVTQEDDRFFGFDDLHIIRNKVEPLQPRWPSILGNAAEAYKLPINFWS